MFKRTNRYACQFLTYIYQPHTPYCKIAATARWVDVGTDDAVVDDAVVDDVAAVAADDAVAAVAADDAVAAVAVSAGDDVDDDAPQESTS